MSFQLQTEGFLRYLSNALCADAPLLSTRPSFEVITRNRCPNSISIIFVAYSASDIAETPITRTARYNNLAI